MPFTYLVALSPDSANDGVLAHLNHIRNPDDNILLIAVIIPPEKFLDVALIDEGAPTPVPESVWNERMALVKARADHVIAEAQKCISGPNIIAKCVEGADARDVILSVAKDSAADFIVLGTRRLTKAKRFLLGSVSQHVLHNFQGFSKGVMIVHKHSDAPSRSIAVALDGSLASYSAVSTAAKMIRPADKLTLYTAYQLPTETLPTITFATVGPPNHQYGEELEAIKGRVTKLQLKAKQVAMSAGCPEDSIEFFSESTSEPQESLTDYANREDIHTVVLGTRGMGAIGRFFVGSTSTYVSLHADKAAVVVVAAPSG